MFQSVSCPGLKGQSRRRQW